MRQVFKKYKWLSSCTGIEVHILPDQTYRIKICSITIEKQELMIDEVFEDTKLANVVKKLDKNKPLALTITGKGVLIKKSSKLEDVTAGTLQALFPSLKSDQFNIQHFNSGGYFWVTIIRKEILKELVAIFSEKGLNVLHVGVGPFAVTHLLRQLNVYGDELIFDGHQILFTEKYIWKDYRYEDGLHAAFPIKVGIEPIKEQYVLAYATAFQLGLYDLLPVTGVNDHATTEALLEYKEEKLFKFKGVMVLGIFFMLLTANFLVFRHFEQDNEQLLSVVNRSTSGAEQVRQKESKIKVNLVKLKELGWNKGISLAWLADQLGQSLPASLKLKDISFNPPEKLKLGQEHYQTGVISISGYVKDIRAINNWIYDLKEEEWVKQVKLKSLSIANEEGQQDFLLYINY